MLFFKRILFIFSIIFCCFSSSISAYDEDNYDTVISDEPSIYIGVQSGLSNTHYSGNKYANPAKASNNSKLTGRVCLGYSFSQFIALELGYNCYVFPKFVATNGNTQNMTQYGIDLSAKATLPLDYGFAFYLKAGANRIHRGVLNSNQGTFAQRDANNKIVPVGALGFNYWFTPNLALDVSWTKTMTIGSLPTVDFYGVGFTYKFT